MVLQAWTQIVADLRRNAFIAKVFELLELRFAVIWNAISALKQFFPKLQSRPKPHFESLQGIHCVLDWLG